MITVSGNGTLVNDPEVVQVGERKVAKFRVAVNAAGGKDTSTGKMKSGFWSVEIWGNRADFVKEHFKKGDPIYVTGELRFNEWKKDGGTTQNETVISASNVGFVPGKRAGGTGEEPAASDDKELDPFNL